MTKQTENRLKIWMMLEILRKTEPRIECKRPDMVVSNLGRVCIFSLFSASRLDAFETSSHQKCTEHKCTQNRREIGKMCDSQGQDRKQYI